jgi:hypothetical protein
VTNGPQNLQLPVESSKPQNMRRRIEHTHTIFKNQYGNSLNQTVKYHKNDRHSGADPAVSHICHGID